ncbi:MAG: hypothetical protein ACLPXB_01920 [Thiobacillaceae bacterium]
MTNGVFIAVDVGITCGAVFGYLASKALGLRLGRKSRAPRVVIIFAGVGALATLVPSFLASIFIGGNLGGGSATAVTTALGFGSVGVPVGLAIGIGVVLTMGPAAGALIGGLAGKTIVAAFCNPTAQDRPLE